MTREEIQCLPAGRELDALVAKRVMGWEFTNGRRRYSCHHCGRDSDDCHCTCHFSEDIEDAWRVVEELAVKRGLSFDLSNLAGDAVRLWSASFKKLDSEDVRGGHAERATAPHAICIAALDYLEKHAGEQP